MTLIFNSEPNSEKAIDTFSETIRDIADGLTRWRFWLTYGVRDISSAFPGNLGGIIFIPFQTGIIVAAFWMIFHDTLGSPVEYYAAYVALGYPLFILMIGSVTSTTSVIKQNANILANMPFPIFAFIMRAVVRLAGSFLLALSVFFILIFTQQVSLSWGGVVAIPGFFMLLAITIANTLTFSLLALYVPNAIAVLRSFSRFALFITPVVWHPEGSVFRANIAFYNPLTHLIAIVREPMLTGTTPYFSWLICGLLLVLMSVTSLVLMKQVRRYIIFRV